MQFQPSPDFSVGMEMEFQLVDAHSLDLVDGIMPLLERFPDSSHIKSEFIQNSVEIASDPCSNVASLGADLRGRASELASVCDSLDMRLVGAGTHPFCERLATITPTPRYATMQAMSGHLSHTLVTFATHVHLGVPDGDEAILLMSELKPYLPVLIAVSANSPFWHGYDTGFAAYRQRVLATTRSYGQPPDFSSWTAFDHAMEKMIATGVFASIDRVHWDLRPRPQLGTLEVRVMDAQSTVTDALSLAAFVRALAAFLRASRDEPQLRPLQNLPWWMHKDNCFMASRFGREVKLVADRNGHNLEFRDLIADLFDKISSYAEALGEGAHLQRLAQRLHTRLGYEGQRAVFAESASLRRVVASLADALAGGAA